VLLGLDVHMGAVTMRDTDRDADTVSVCGEGLRVYSTKAACQVALRHAPQRLHEEVSADYNDMIYATSAAEIEVRRRAFIRKWRLKCKAVADSLEEAGDRLFAFTRSPVSQWKSARTTNAIERLHEEFKRRIKIQTVLPSETAAMLFWALLAAGQITMRKVDGWQTLTHKLVNEPIDLAA
jgi:putative transposase